MSSFVKLTAIMFAAILLPVSLLAGASHVKAEEQCSGTLCDLYYGKTSSFDDKPKQAAPTPVTVPRGTILGMFSGGNAQQPGAAPGTAAPAKKPILGVGGGGIAAMARGEKAEQCSGTLCDLYYGKSSSFDDPPAQPAAAAAAPGSQLAAEAAPEAPVEAAPPPRGFEARPEPPRCSSARDPWSCYR